ncbi:MAG: hypothetical protein A3E80_04250 [Chlamydiae bacterium RIFCSPHIGHO2_12_FULL_49_9]|nr:MAG: hypothetical protein A3E80_04250 [Chlamydiae bacterium RIFCSPHIGHO2_12_FULL_49_9]
MSVESIPNENQFQENVRTLEQPDATWTGRIQEMRCGNQGLTIVIVNLVATAAIAGVAAFYSAALMPVAALGSVVILPSIALFGPKDYLRYLPVPLQLGVEHVVSLLLVKVEADGSWKPRFPGLKWLDRNWGHFHDRNLSNGLINYVAGLKGTDTKWLDAGCGAGSYVKDAHKSGMKFVYGCDGNPTTKKLGTNFEQIMLHLKECFTNSKTSESGPYDVVSCFEVAEHIPAQFTDTVLNNLISQIKDDGILVLSWARKGQGGLGHVNEQDAFYVLKKMDQLGFSCDEKDSRQLRRSTSPNTPWFFHTLFVFKRRNS